MLFSNGAVMAMLAVAGLSPTVLASFDRVHQDVLAASPTYGLFEGALFLDYDNDGLLDVFLCSSQVDPSLNLPPSAFSQRLLRRTAEGDYVDVSVEAGINTEAPFGCASAAAADFDNDGDQDIVTSLWSPLGGCMLWENHGDGKFSGTPLSDCPAWQGGLAIGDVDGDGLLDVYATSVNALAFDLTNIPSTMMRNLGGLQFEVQSMTGTEDVLYPCDAAFADLDDDGDADLIVLGCNELSSSTNSGVPGPLYLFRNMGNFEFELDNAGFGLPDDLSGFWMSTAFGDVNNDGYLDVYVGNAGCVLGSTCPGIFQHALLLNNGDGTYTNVAQDAGVANERFNWGGAFVDVDNDGNQDLVTVGNFAVPGFFLEPTLAGAPVYSPGAVFKNSGSFPLTLVEEFGIVTGTGLAVGDFDGDGLEDLCIQKAGLPLDPIDESPDAVLLHNQEETDNTWIKVQLEGVCSNRDGVGSKVTVYYKNRDAGDDNEASHQAKQVKLVVSGTSAFSSHDKVLTFGLGHEGFVTKIAVQWPDQGGKQQTVGNIDNPRSNTLVHIVQNGCN